MKSYKSLLNSLSHDSSLRQLTDDEIKKLRNVFLTAFQDLAACCEKYGLTVMLIGGSAIGAVRHQGFIPWDDDLDVAMPRKDFEKLKGIFEKELGEQYVLSSPNYTYRHNHPPNDRAFSGKQGNRTGKLFGSRVYKGNANNRFPMMMVKGTLLVEAGNSPENDGAKIKIDIFIIENIPQNPIHRYVKGIWCSLLMFMASYEETYECQNDAFKQYMCKTTEGKKVYYRRVRLGRFFSFFCFQKWMNLVDSACQYKKSTSLMGIPSGRGHYFGEIRPAKTFLPVSKGMFEGMEVNLPGDPDDYIRNLYGDDYMTLPPVEKRERHFIMDIKFKGDE